MAVIEEVVIVVVMVSRRCSGEGDDKSSRDGNGKDNGVSESDSEGCNNDGGECHGDNDNSKGNCLAVAKMIW